MSFAPTDVSGIALWLKADTATYQDDAGSTPATADGDPIGKWTDQSGNSNYVTQSTSGNKPVLKQVTQGGKTYWVVRFDGSNDILNLNSTISTSTVVVYAVVRRGGSSRHTVIAGNANSFQFCTDGTKSRVIKVGSAVITTGSANISADNVAILRAKYASSSTSLRTRRASDATASGAQTFSDPLRYVGGAIDATTNPFFGDIAELIVYTSDVSSPDEASIEDYLVSRYLQPRLFVTDGNSLTASGPGGTGTNNWPSRMPNYWSTSNWGNTNIAVSGQTTASMVSDEALQLGSLYDASHTSGNVALYWEGSNEIKGGASQGTTESNLSTYGTNAISYGFNPVIVCTITPRTDYTGGMETIRSAVNTTLRADFNVATSNPYLFAAKAGTTYAHYLYDCASRTEFSNASNTTYFADGIHLTSAGYDIFASDVNACLGVMFPAGMAPTITSDGGGSTASISVQEGYTPVTTVIASGDTPIEFTITGGADLDIFDIEADGDDRVKLLFLATPDYENPIDAGNDNTYTVVITATNAAGSDSQTITVTVTNDPADDPTGIPPTNKFLRFGF